jgi:hypothetical protein
MQFVHWRFTMEGITAEFNQLRKLVNRLKRQCEHVEEDVKAQFADFLEVGGNIPVHLHLYWLIAQFKDTPKIHHNSKTHPRSTTIQRHTQDPPLIIVFSQQYTFVHGYTHTHTLSLSLSLSLSLCFFWWIYVYVCMHVSVCANTLYTQQTQTSMHVSTHDRKLCSFEHLGFASVNN